MEKGKLNIRRKDKKNVILSLTKENGKLLPISDSSLRKADNWEGFADGDHEVSYEMESGLPVSITIGNKTITRQQVQAPPQTHQPNRNHYRNHPAEVAAPIIDSATAPYNFVPMNEQVLSVNEDDIPAFNTYKGYDGFIDLDITAKSPIYIRKNLSPAELEREEQLGHNNHNQDARKFKDSLSGFNRPLGNDYRIPGSSLRGMIRNLYEIVTYSKMTMLDDHKLYYRSFADSSNELQDQYSNCMIEKIGGAYRPKVSAGYIRRQGRHYEILEASEYYRVEEDLVLENKVIPHYMANNNGRGYKSNSAYNRFIESTPFVNVIFKATPESNHNHSVMMRYSKVSDVREPIDPLPDGFQKGCMVLSGWIPSRNRGKHLHWIIPEPSTTKHQVPDSLVKDYEKDTNRKGTNILKWAKNGSTPCFFIMGNAQVKAFGHTGMFRMVYDKSIGDLRPDAHKTSDLDMAEAVFGRIVDKKARVGRLFFEDAICTEPKETPEALYPKILSGPKASSFQLYLHQDTSSVRINRRNTTGIKNYDSQGARLAGHKLYWHRNHEDWIADPHEVEQHRTQYTKIHPLDTGSMFNGRIRFVNLSKEELGALLFVLNLPEGCCHKLGMAKPLGLGSVRINAKLSLIDRKQRYTDLLATGIDESKEDKYVQAFADHLKAGLNSNQSDIWNIDRLKELKKMLDHAHMPPAAKTRYMEIEHYTPDRKKTNEYKYRPILKKPTQTK